METKSIKHRQNVMSEMARVFNIKNSFLAGNGKHFIAFGRMSPLDKHLNGTRWHLKQLEPTYMMQETNGNTLYRVQYIKPIRGTSRVHTMTPKQVVSDFRRQLLKAKTLSTANKKVDKPNQAIGQYTFM